MPLAAFPKCYTPALVSGDMSNHDWLKIADEQVGLDGVELYWPTIRALPRSALSALRRDAEGRGLTIPMLCVSPDFTHPDPEVRRAQIVEERHAIQAASVLGVTYVRVLSGQAHPGVERSTGVEWAVTAITGLLDFADQYGVILAMENHFRDHFWTYPEFAQAGEVFLEIVDRIPVNAPFGVQYDPSNTLVAGEDPVALLARIAQRVVTFAASDRRLVSDPSAARGSRLVHGVVGEGDIDFDALFVELARVGFNGWVSIEDGDDSIVGAEHLRRSAEFIRALLPRLA